MSAFHFIVFLHIYFKQKGINSTTFYTCPRDILMPILTSLSMVRVQKSDVRFGLKVGQTSPKWDKNGTFSDQFVVLSEPFWIIITHFGSNSNSPVSLHLRVNNVYDRV